MDEYCYPEELYCIKCDADVRADIVTKSETITRDDGLAVTFEFSAAVCPECGDELCRRDYYAQLAKAVNENSVKGV